MPGEHATIYKLGGYSFIASAIFFAFGTAFELMAGQPPSAGAEIIAWSQSSKLYLAFLNEAFFFAAIFLIPGVIALYFSLAGASPAKTAAGCGIMAVAIALLVMLLVVQGRLIYPVYGILASAPATAELVLAIFYGGLHAAFLLFATATLLVSLAMRNSAYGKYIAYLGIATSVLDIVGSYQFLFGPILTIVCRGFFSAWFVAAGVGMLRMGKEANASGSNAA